VTARLQLIGSSVDSILKSITSMSRGSGQVFALLTDGFGGHGGIAKYNENFLTAMAQAGVGITVLARNGSNDAPRPTGIVQFPAQGGRTRFALKALSAVPAARPRAIFCGHLNYAPLAAFLARTTRAMLIVQLHGVEIWTRPSALQARALEAADFVLCVSRHTREQLLAFTGVRPERAIVLPNMVEDAFLPGAAAGFRRTWSLDGKFVLLTVSRLDSREQYKGQDRVIAALPDLVRAGHDVAYVIAGDGDDRPRLEKLAAEAGVTDRVIFTGRLPGGQLIEAYRAADLFVMPSTGEGFGIVFLEAMACGTPALGLDVGGAVDAFADGEFGSAVSQEAFPGELARLVAAAPPHRATLSAAVHRRFGSAAFKAHVRAFAMQAGMIADSRRAAA
jgi:phosphatidylinositol alpha-1,6-mannosyltransferase